MIDYAFQGPMYLWEKVDWVPGAKSSLIKLSAQYPLCIATNAPHSGTEEMIKALDLIGAKDYFKKYFSSKELGCGKPDPRFFLAISEKLNVTPEDCVMIGDRYNKDIAGAKSAGMHTVFYNDKKEPGPFEHADIVIEDMGELVEAITSLEDGE